MKIEISQCQNTKCNQKFTPDNIKLAVWLHGVILLTQGRPPKPDPLLPAVPDKRMEDFDPQGYIGLTCPKCLETSLYQGSSEDVLEFKEQLQTMVSLAGSEPDDKSKQFKHDLRYYSPFGLEPTTQDRFEVDGFIFDGPEDDPEYFQDQLTIHIADEIPDSWERYCSYVLDRDTPAGAFTHIFWFKEEHVSDLLEFEKANGVRVFPRYHYITDLVRKIESLQKYNHQSERVIAAARSQHKRQEKARYEKFLESGDAQGDFKPLAFDDFLKDVQSKITNVPQLTSDFLEMLISGPETLKDISGTPTSQCKYLWARINPFHGLEYPESFPAELESRSTEEDLIQHGKIVALAQKNLNKQYTQDFLRENLVDFLEEYEELIQGNEFSYADAWQLKASYLEGLYKQLINGLSDEAPYVMKKEGKAWKIVFNSKPMSGLRRIGFAYLYHLISHPNEYFFHADLFIAAGKGTPVSKEGYQVEYADAKGDSIATRMIDDQGLRNLFNLIKKLKNELDDAIEFKNEEESMKLAEELKHTRKFLSEVFDPKRNRIRYEKDANAKKVTDAVGTAIKRALEDIKEEDPDAYQHFSSAIGINNLYQDALMYRPGPGEEIEWITVG